MARVAPCPGRENFSFSATTARAAVMTVPRQFHPLTYVGFRKSPALVACQ
nr:MAG TPA: hypothetical protein [Caudoviricetes sp.]